MMGLRADAWGRWLATITQDRSETETKGMELVLCVSTSSHVEYLRHLARFHPNEAVRDALNEASCAILDGTSLRHMDQNMRPPPAPQGPRPPVVEPFPLATHTMAPGVCLVCGQVVSEGDPHDH